MSQAKNKDLCDYNKLKRPRYFHGMLLDEKDFEAQQAYHMSKRRIFNRLLHGWGIVCGLGLQWKKGKQSITITPGLALDCMGNEIWVCDPYSVDLTKLLASRPRASQDECREDEGPGVGTELDLCIYYHEIHSDPVPVYASGSDCKEQTCDYSRIKEGFCVRLQDPCDDSAKGGGLLEEFCHCECGETRACDDDLANCPEVACEGLEGAEACKCRALAKFCSKSLPCPECDECHCGEHCVVLGRVRVDEEGCLVEVCINECRRYVLSGRMIQHLITSVYAGTEQWFTKDGEGLPSPQRIVHNPIYALCWFVRRFFMTGRRWVRLIDFIRRGTQVTPAGETCLGPSEPGDRYVTIQGAEAMISQVQSQRKVEHARMEARMGEMTEDRAPMATVVALQKQVAALDLELEQIKEATAKGGKRTSKK